MILGASEQKISIFPVFPLAKDKIRDILLKQSSGKRGVLPSRGVAQSG